MKYHEMSILLQSSLNSPAHCFCAKNDKYIVDIHRGPEVATNVAIDLPLGSGVHVQTKCAGAVVRDAGHDLGPVGGRALEDTNVLRAKRWFLRIFWRKNRISRRKMWGICVKMEPKEVFAQRRRDPSQCRMHSTQGFQSLRAISLHTWILS